MLCPKTTIKAVNTIPYELPMKKHISCRDAVDRHAFSHSLTDSRQIVNTVIGGVCGKHCGMEWKYGSARPKPYIYPLGSSTSNVIFGLLRASS